MTSHEYRSLDEALALVRSGQRVFVHGGVATPHVLLDALVARADELRDVELIHLHTEGPAHYANPEYADSFRVASLFVGPNLRGKLRDGVDYLPCFLSEMPALFRSGRRPLDVALVHVSPPDRHGFFSLGACVDVAAAAVHAATLVIAQVNPQMPRVHGDGVLHVDDLDVLVEVDEPIPEIPRPDPTPEQLAIGEHIAALVEDGATLQAGIGAIPDAALRALRGHRHLGLHTELWSDGAFELVECGALDNSRKAFHRGRSVSSFAAGSRRFYDFLDDNPSVVHLSAEYVNDPSKIARNPKVTAINSAVEVDLTGQVCADSIGSRIISGVGGQMDFIRGASLSDGGRPIIALPSRTKRGEARIVAQLKPGAGVVTTRAHVHDVVTEYGVAALYGKTLTERARALIAIAHPDDRERLVRTWHEMRGEMLQV